MSARVRAYILLLIAVAIWGFAGPVIKFTLGYFDPVVFLTYRFFLTSLVLIPLLFILEPHFWLKLSHFTPRDWFYLVICGLTGTSLQLLLLFWGFDLTTSIDASLISSASPILSTLAAWWFLKDRITTREKIGITIAFIGSIVVVFQPFSGSLAGNLLVVAADVVWVAYLILSKKLLRLQLSPLFITASNFFIGLLSMSVILFFSRPTLYSLLSTPFSAHLGVVYMALLSGALAYFLFQRAQKSIETSEANVFTYLMPLFAPPLAFLWLHEPITLPFLIGSAVIATGVVISEIK
mgnify:CR=1 FL=1